MSDADCIPGREPRSVAASENTNCHEVINREDQMPQNVDVVTASNTFISDKKAHRIRKLPIYRRQT